MFSSDCKDVSNSSSVLGTTGWTTFLCLTMAGSMSRNVTSSMLPRSLTSSSYRTQAAHVLFQLCVLGSISPPASSPAEDPVHDNVEEDE